MMDRIGLRIAEVLAARLCHELISPIGAVNNGLELMEDEAEFAADALALVNQSGREAARRLQFYRIAYGSQEDVRAEVARTAALALFEEGKIRCEWPANASPLPAGWLKLACNLMLLAAEALSRGGTITVQPAETAGLAIVAAGAGARMPADLDHLLTAPLETIELTPRTIQAVFTRELAGRLGHRVTVSTPAGDRVLFVVG